MSITPHEYFAKRLDAYLATLTSDAAKRVFLTGEARKWEARYRTFVRTGGAIHGKPSPIYGQPQATDFLITIADINDRLAALTVTEAA
jgi:hypothetical protein